MQVPREIGATDLNDAWAAIDTSSAYDATATKVFETYQTGRQNFGSEGTGLRNRKKAFSTFSSVATVPPSDSSTPVTDPKERELSALIASVNVGTYDPSLPPQLLPLPTADGSEMLADSRETYSDDEVVEGDDDPLADCDVILNVRSERSSNAKIPAWVRRRDANFTDITMSGKPDSTSTPPPSRPASPGLPAVGLDNIGEGSLCPINENTQQLAVPSMTSDSSVSTVPRTRPPLNVCGVPVVSTENDTDRLQRTYGMPITADGSRVLMTTWEKWRKSCYEFDGWQGGKAILKAIMWIFTICTLGLLRLAIWGGAECWEWYHRDVEVLPVATNATAPSFGRALRPEGG